MAKMFTHIRQIVSGLSEAVMSCDRRVSPQVFSIRSSNPCMPTFVS